MPCYHWADVGLGPAVETRGNEEVFLHSLHTVAGEVQERQICRLQIVPEGCHGVREDIA